MNNNENESVPITKEELEDAITNEEAIKELNFKEPKSKLGRAMYPITLFLIGIGVVIAWLFKC